MIKKIQHPISTFQKYLTEADGDDSDQVSVKVTPRKNRGTDYSDDTDSVRVTPHANRGTDYTKDTDTEDDNQEDNQDTQDEPDNGDGGTDQPQNNNENQDQTDNQNNDDTGAEDADGDDPDEPDTGDGGTDYSQDGGEEGGDDQQQNNDQEQPQENNASPDDEKKYYMYTRYLHLYNTVDTFIDKLHNVVKDDATQNAVIKKVSDNLNDIYDNMFDYMTVKYKTASYVEVLLYFETIITTIKLNFELLRNNKIDLKQ